MSRQSLRKIASALVSFTKSESKGILLLLPLLIIVGAVINSLNRTPIEKSFPQLADLISDSIYESRVGGKTTYGDSRTSYSSNSPETGSSELFAFDPNTIDFRGLRSLGFSRQAAAALINYRTKYKKVFELPTDFAACYQVNDSIFNRLEPYIIIGEQFRRAVCGAPSSRSLPSDSQTLAHHKTSHQPLELFHFDPNVLDSSGFRRLGFSARQTQTIIKYRTMRDGFRTIEEFGECYSVGTRIDELRPYITIVPPKPKAVEKLDINSADIEMLVEIRGIGLVTAQRIVCYRDRLGGFANITQLAEVEGVTEKNFELFSKEISVNSSRIKKIDVNFATAEIMATHPYMSGVIIRKVLKYKQLKGGLRSIEEMIKDKILSDEEAKKLSHYLVFTPLTPN